MLTIESNDPRLEYPGFYNIYPIQNEISSLAKKNDTSDYDKHSFLLDDHYGRILNPLVKHHYGNTSDLSPYQEVKGYPIVDQLRVPFRRVPIYAYESLEQIKLILGNIESKNSAHEILIRGQSSIYTINRSIPENNLLYGEDAPKEPSFHPSFLRSNFNEFFTYSLWHSQTALMLNDIGVDLSLALSPNELSEYFQDVLNIKRSFDYTPIALGIAQHYGLPSIGLDLTKDINVASWFASHKLDINENGDTITSPITDFSESTLFIFRCPKDAVFSHKSIKPKFINNTRPDRQDAWFSHVGWGHAKNELASFLVCGIRLDASILDSFRPDFEKHLFPDRTQDLILDYFLNAKQNRKYVGEVKRALSRVYSLIPSSDK